MSISHLRQEYTLSELRESDAAADAIEQFTRWFKEAQDAGIVEPNAMTLATCGSDGIPQARIVLLKDFGHAGFTFYTSYLSEKAAQIKDNPQVSLLFWWEKLQRTVRIVGPVSRVPREDSQQYFASRPRASQLGAWASQQSQVLPDRQSLEARYAEVEKQFEGSDVPTPDFWGGYRVVPAQLEFWQGQRSRLHDRLRYTRQPDGTWAMQRLSP